MLGQGLLGRGCEKMIGLRSFSGSRNINQSFRLVGGVNINVINLRLRNKPMILTQSIRHKE